MVLTYTSLSHRSIPHALGREPRWHVSQSVSWITDFQETNQSHPGIGVGFTGRAPLTTAKGVTYESTKQVQWFCIFKDHHMGDL